MDFVHQGAAVVAPFIHSYGLIALFILVCLESIGLPLPGEATLITASALALEGQLPLIGVFLAAASAATLGDNVGYLIGRKGGRLLLERFGHLVGLTQQRRNWIEKLYTDRGPIIVVGARFVVVLRQLNGLVAGSMAMPWSVFLLANAAGAVLWAGAWCFAPYLVGRLL
jgi:membrane protein DedA with SNARE-associated domain